MNSGKVIPLPETGYKLHRNARNRKTCARILLALRLDSSSGSHWRFGTVFGKVQSRLQLGTESGPTPNARRK